MELFSYFGRDKVFKKKGVCWRERERVYQLFVIEKRYGIKQKIWKENVCFKKIEIY